MFYIFTHATIEITIEDSKIVQSSLTRTSDAVDSHIISTQSDTTVLITCSCHFRIGSSIHESKVMSTTVPLDVKYITQRFVRYFITHNDTRITLSRPTTPRDPRPEN